MQRQSLGSPGREKQYDAVSFSDDQNRRDSSTSSFSGVDDDEIKPEKPHRSPEKYIHLIPVLILFCFILLYLFSHHPSTQDLAHFRGFNFKHSEKSIGEVKDIKGDKKNKKVLKRSKAFVIRSLSNLDEDDFVVTHNIHKVSSHRKFGYF